MSMRVFFCLFSFASLDDFQKTCAGYKGGYGVPGCTCPHIAVPLHVMKVTRVVKRTQVESVAQGKKLGSKGIVVDTLAWA